MDGPEFDKLARKLTSFTSRRQALGGLLGAAAAITGLGAAAEAKKNGKGKDAKKGAGKGRDAKKGDKGRRPGKDQCASGCASSAAICTTNGDCPTGSTCIGNECRRTCGAGVPCPGGSSCTAPGSFPASGTCLCSPAVGCAGASTCSASGFCVSPPSGGGAGACQTGLDRNQCGNPGTNNGVCSVCSGTQVCAPVEGRAGGSCQTRAGCGTGSCQFGAICTTLNDNRVCGAYSDGGSFVCRPACPTGLVCRGGDVTPGGGISRTCGAPLCTATSCPSGCCQEQADFEQGILAGCQSGTSRFACGRANTACRNCDRIGGPNCGCFSGECSCTTTTTTTTSTTTTSTTAAPPQCSAATCAAGCCPAGGGDCTPSSRQTCGLNGATCQNCRADNNKRCRNGRCRKN